MTESLNQPPDVRAATGLWLKWETVGVRTRRPLDRSLTIGRDAGCDICLTERTVSRHHAVVSIESGRVHIDASTSTNGIKLTEGNTKRATLNVGQPFRIGSTTFAVVEWPAAHAGSRPFAAPIAPPAQAHLLGQPQFAPSPVPPGPQFAAPQTNRAPSRSHIWLGAMGALGLVVVLALVGAAWFISNVSQSSGSDSSDGVGVAPALEQVDSSWASAPAITDGFSVKYPPDWHMDQPAPGDVVLRQPDSPDDRPVPNITFEFDPGVAVTEPAAVEGMSASEGITVAGLQGWEYHQVGYATPSAASFIDLPYHGGRLRITATRGPAVDLVPQLDEILKTMEVAP
jgi:hypothetical protein